MALLAPTSTIVIRTLTLSILVPMCLHADRVRDRSREVGVRPVRYHHGHNRMVLDLVGWLSWCPLRQLRQRVGFDHHCYCESRVTCILSLSLSLVRVRVSNDCDSRNKSMNVMADELTHTKHACDCVHMTNNHIRALTAPRIAPTRC